VSDSSADNPRQPPGLIASAATLAASLGALLGTRAAYALLELGDARDALLRVLLLGAAALGAAALAFVGLSVLLVVVFWEALGWGILLILSLAYGVLAWMLLQRARRILAEGRIGLPVTLAELRKDRDALFGAPPEDSQ
jgi:uncharacterized membrane protein YqjE